MPWTMKVVSGVDQDGHQAAAPWIFSTGAPGGLVQRDAAVGVVDAVLLEDLEALLLPGAGDAEDRDLLGRVVAELQAGLDHAAGDDVHARVGDDRHHHRDLVHAGLLQHELGQAAGLGDRRVAADLAVVGRACRRGRARRRTASASRRRRRSPGRGCRRTRSRCRPRRGGPWRRPPRRPARTGWPRAPGASPRRRRRGRRAASCGARAPRSPCPCARRARRTSRRRAAPERVDLGERHVVVDEQLRARRVTIGTSLFSAEPVTPVEAITSLAWKSREGQDVGEVPAADLVGLLLGDLLDVDAADRREDHHRLLARAVPDDAGVVLLLDLRLRGRRARRAACGRRSPARGCPWRRPRPPRGCRRT